MQKADKPVIVFMGTPDFAVPSLEALVAANMAPALVITQPDRPVGRKRVLTPPPVKVAALSHDIPVLQPESMRGDEGKTVRNQVRALAPELIVTASYGHILPESFLRLASVEALNVHGSLLPQYRGASPVQQAVINGDQETGISLIRMVKEMDAGPVFTVRKVQIPMDMTAAELMDELAHVAAQMLPDALREILDGRLTPEEQDHDAATYVSMLDRSSGEIDWSKPADQIHNLVRGTYPWPGAVTLYDGKRMKIHRTEVVSKTIQADAKPGTILTNQKGLTVACGYGVLRLLEIQPEGKKAQLTTDTSHNYPLGASFDAFHES